MRRSVVVLGASSVAAALAWVLVLAPELAASGELGALARVNGFSARFLSRWLFLGLVGGVPALALEALNFLEEHGWLPPEREASRGLGEWPFRRDVAEVILGEAHAQDGSHVPDPFWFTVPLKTFFTHMLVVGGSGRGKTSGVVEPLLEQFIHLRAEPYGKLGGLLIDPKGNMRQVVRSMLREAGRESDYYEISMPGARWNVINRPDLTPMALGGFIAELLQNVEGESSGDPFWRSSARQLAVQSVRALRLARSYPPTLDAVYRVAASVEAYGAVVAEARARRSAMDAEELAELESLETWLHGAHEEASSNTRSNVAATLNNLCFRFDEPSVRRCFCPRPEDETFEGFEALIRDGRVVVFAVPQSVHKDVSAVLATAAKLHYMDALLARLARAETTNADVGRPCFLMIDEYSNYMSYPADVTLLSQGREARAMVVSVVQSHKSLAANVRKRDEADVILANFGSKAYLGVECASTAEDAARLCGRIERLKETVSVSENAQRVSWSFLDRQAVSEGGRSASASKNWTPREEYLFPTRVFTSLGKHQAIVKVFDGEDALPPWVIYLRPRGAKGSWFDRRKEPPAPGLAGEASPWWRRWLRRIR